MKRVRLFAGIGALTLSSYIFATHPIDDVLSPIVAAGLLFSGLVILFVRRR